MFISDEPIQSKKDDNIDRYQAASKIADMIKQFNSDKNYVIGIEGEYGSGKTSFLNLFIEALQNCNHQNINTLTIKFNPWNFSNQDELIKDFFYSIINGLKKIKGNGKKDTLKKISNYFVRLLKQSELTFAPEISFLGLIKIKLGNINKIDNDNTLEEQKVEINKLLKNCGKRLIIIIDDIDRLDTFETQLIFKLVKLTANFSNIIFILAYDRNSVCRRLDQQGIKGEEYLKKIIQMSFTLSKPEPKNLWDILLKHINTTFENSDENYWDKERWSNFFYSALINFFSTIRDIKYYINSLQIDLEIVNKEEVNPIDFLGIEAIRVFAPEIYKAMANKKEVFCFSEVCEDKQDRINNKNMCEQIITNNSPDGLSDTIREVIKQLFPKVKDLYSNNHTNTYSYNFDLQQESDCRKKLRVCSKDIFDKYFSLSLPSTSLSIKSVDDFLSSNNVTEYTNKLKNFQKQDKLKLLLKQLPDHLNNLANQQFENMLVSIFNFTEDITDKRSFNTDNIDFLTSSLAWQILKRIYEKERTEFLKKILNSTNNSVLTPIVLVRDLEMDLKAKKSLLSYNEIDDLKKLCVNKINKAAKNGSLVKNKNLSALLFSWKDWESEEVVKKYVNKIIKTDEGLFAILSGFVSESTNGIKTINRNSLVSIMDINELDKSVEQIDKTNLVKEKADIINLYKNSQ